MNEHVLCGLILLSRIGDIGTTFLVTPNLELEANPIMRRLGWRFALLTLSACLVPYFNVDMGIMILVPFLMVSAGNASKIWIARTMGERPYKKFLLDIAARSRRRDALAGLALSAFFVVLLGCVLMLFYPDPADGPAFWFGAGIVLYGLAMIFHGSIFVFRLFKEAKTPPVVR